MHGKNYAQQKLCTTKNMHCKIYHSVEDGISLMVMCGFILKVKKYLYRPIKNLFAYK